MPMNITATVKVEGLHEMVDAFRELPKATGKNVMRRVMKARAQKLADDAKALCPVYDGPPKKFKGKGGITITVIPGALKKSIKVSIRLSRSQARDVKDTKEYTEVYIGPGPLPYAHMTEFGTAHEAPRPFMRPSWDKNKGNLLDNIRDDLWTEIRKAAERLARKTARLKAKG